MKRRPSILVIGTLALLLSACGGSGTTTTDRTGAYTLRGSTDYTGATIIVEEASGNDFRVTGDASWAADAEAAERGGINVGSLDFTAPLRGDSLVFDSEPIGENGEFYRLVIRFHRNGLEAVESYPKGSIGYHGFNVSFDGQYEKR